jgi:mannosyltransferase OCH1-like enzyme
MTPINFYNSITIPWGKSSTVFNFNNNKWKILEKLYNENFNLSKSNNLYIPKIIHQIWIGTEIPESVKVLSNQIQYLNPDWEYKLWTDDSFDFLDSNLLKKINKIENLGARSDVLRYLIINKFGGLYLDCDFVPIKNFNDLIYNNVFIAGICNPDESNLPLINNGFFASNSNNPILKMIITNILGNLDILFNISKQDEVFKYTGPDIFTNQIFNFITNNDNTGIVIYPSTYLYPISCRNKFRINKKTIEKSTYNETFAIHLWNASWFETNKSLYSKFKLLLPYRYFIILSKIMYKLKKIVQ